MTSIVELFPKCRKLAYDSRQVLSQVQNQTKHSSELFLCLEELSRQLDIMERLLSNETPAQREMWKVKIQELRHDVYTLRQQGEYYQNQANSSSRQTHEREELMAMRRRRKMGANGEDAHNMQNLAAENDSWQSSQNMMGDVLGSAEANLFELRDQRTRMKGIKRVVFTIANNIGLSNALMQVVERRDITDLYLVLCGMVVTLFVIYLCWFW
jgi:Golgi SNAP receptor complex protein 2